MSEKIVEISEDSLLWIDERYNRLRKENKEQKKEIERLNNIIAKNEYSADELNEIERLNKRIEDLNIINEEHQMLNAMIRKELQQKENIIKEVREYIKEACWLDEVNKPNSLGHKQTMKVLEILDKE